MQILTHSPLALQIALGFGLVASTAAQAPIGESYCPAVPSTSGATAELVGAGSATLEQNRFLLRASNLPVGSLGVFLVSREAGFTPGVGGGLGSLCLGGAIARLSGPIVATSRGQLEHSIDLPALRVSGTSVLAGDTLRFQLIFRDRGPLGSTTTNSTNGLAVTFACGSRLFPEPIVEVPGAWQMAGGDFDRDGDLDLVAVQVHSQITILENVGTAAPTVHSSVLVRSGASLGSIATGDINGDGALDVVVAEQFASRVWLLQGDGRLGFGAPISIAAPGESSLVKLADLDGDGRLDLITASRTVPLQGFRVTAQIQTSSTPGAPTTFGPATSVRVQGWGACSIDLMAEDIDGDGRDEVIVNSSDPRLEVIELSALGTLGVSASIVTAFPSFRMTMGDLNGDGNLDVVYSSGLPSAHCNGRLLGDINVLEGDGSGLFLLGQQLRGDDVGLFGITLSDLDGDGDLDVLAHGPVGLKRFRNDGTGRLIPRPLQQTSGGPYSTLALDIDGDSTPDLVYLRRDPEVVVVARGLGEDAGFDLARILPFTSRPYGVTAADFDGDGHMDVAVITAFTDVQVLRGDGSGDLATHTVVSFPPSPIDVVAIDLDQDGDLDLVGLAANRVSVAHNDGSGSFTTDPMWLAASDAVAIDCGDLDGDGRPDCVVAERGRDRLMVLSGDGSGGFRAPSYIRTGRGPSAVRLVDLNADGILDLVVTEEIDRTLSVRLNLGAGRFAAPAVNRIRAGARSIIADDWNGDGHVDLAFLGMAVDEIFVFEGAGTGVLAPSAVLDAPNARYGIVSADFNLDGRPDLATTWFSEGAVAVYPTLADGTFAPVQLFSVYSSPAGLTVADLNEDGLPDIVAGTDFFLWSISVLLNGCR